MSELVVQDRPSDGILLLTINRPEQLNAITLEVQRAVDRAVVAAADDPATRCIVLAGAGERGLSAGYDVDELTSMTEDEHTLVQLEREELLWRWYASPVPTVVACRGITYGAGALFAVCADLRVGGPATRVKVTAAMYGGANLTWVLDELVGAAVARDMLMTSRVVDGAEGLRVGLLNRLADHDDAVLPDALEVAGAIAANDPAAVREVKRLLLAGPGRETRARYDAENTAMRTTIKPRPMKEVFGAFLRRRGRAE